MEWKCYEKTTPGLSNKCLFSVHGLMVHICGLAIVKSWLVTGAYFLLKFFFKYRFFVFLHGENTGDPVSHTPKICTGDDIPVYNLNS